MDIANQVIPAVKYVETFGRKINFSRLKFKHNKYTDLLKQFAGIKESERGVELKIDFISTYNMKNIINKLQITKDILIDESYYIIWHSNNINIKSISNKGIINGIMTIAQLLNNIKYINECEIFDYPDLKIRGLHLDLKFHNFTNHYLKRIVKQAAYYKYNTILLEYEDKFPLRNNRDISSLLSFTESGVEEFINYSSNFGIEIIPLQQSLGHSEYILRLEKYIELRENLENTTQFCPLKKGTFDLITSIYDEYLKKHPSKYFHIGCDEARYIGFCEKCKKYSEKYGKEKLFTNYINKIIKYLNKKDRIAILWGDMLEKNKSSIKNLKGKYLLAYWDYVSTKNFAYMKNYEPDKTISVSAIRMMADKSIFPDYEFHINNIYGFIKASVKNKLLGHIVSGWAISRVPFESTVMGLIAGAEFSWTSDTNISLFQKKFLYQYFKSKNKKLLSLIYEINHNIKYEIEEIKDIESLERDGINKIRANIKSLSSIKKNKEFVKFIEAGIFYKKYQYHKITINKILKNFNQGKIKPGELTKYVYPEIKEMKNLLKKVYNIYKKYYEAYIGAIGLLNEKESVIDRELRNIRLLEESTKYIDTNKLEYIPLEKVVILRDYFSDLKNRIGEFHKGYSRGMDSWFNFSI